MTRFLFLGIECNIGKCEGERESLTHPIDGSCDTQEGEEVAEALKGEQKQGTRGESQR